MVLYVSPLDSESELQWDPDSYPNQAYNCGPSSIEKVANYFKNLTTYGIERTRNLATAANYRGTTAAEQSTMLMKRGIDNDAVHYTVAQINAILKTGRRPVSLALKMSYIPQSVKGNTFNGAHSVTGLAYGVVNGEPGIWVNEPNQRRGSTTYRKNRFFAERYWAPAYKALGSWAIVPTKDKVIPTRRPLVRKWIVTADVLNIRSAPTVNSTVLGSLARGATFTSNLIELAGGSYKVGQVTRREWLGYLRNGRQVWVARWYCKEA